MENGSTQENKNTDTNNSTHHNKTVSFLSGHESVQGRRWSMEDTFIMTERLEYKSLPSGHNFALYAVFDGHGGKDTANLLVDLIPKNIVANLNSDATNVEDALKIAFASTDKQILERAKREGWSNGSTAVLSLIVDNVLYLANIGDSECVLAKKKDDGHESILLSFKHKPSDSSEKERIERAGGSVYFGRVMGTLAVARAFGDIDFKAPHNKASLDYVSAEPYILKQTISHEHDFLIVACDGLWDKLTYDDAVQFVAVHKASGKTATETAQLLVKNALDRGTLDNVTAIVVYFVHS